MINISKLVDGFRSFKSTKLEMQRDIIKHLAAQGHKPSTMVISCCDIQISPAEIFSTNPGELFVINNIGGLVPKYATEGINGIMSAFEYAIFDLQVSNILVLGHKKSATAKIIMSEDFLSDKKMTKAMKAWLSIAVEARDAVKAQLPNASPEEQEAAFEKEAIIVSLRNLLSFPEISKRVDAKKLTIFGMQFDMENGDIFLFNHEKQVFDSLS